MKQWLLSPLNCEKEINDRLDLVELFTSCHSFDEANVHDQISSALNTIKENLRNVKDVSLLLNRICDCRSNVRDWDLLVKSVVSIDFILEAVESISDSIQRHRICANEAMADSSYTLLRKYREAR